MLRRRTLLRFGVTAIAACAGDAIAATTPYPAHPVYMIVGFSAGGNTDIVARLIGDRLSRQLGQPFIVENRTGAATTIATEQVIIRRQTATRCWYRRLRTRSMPRSTAT